MQSTSNDEDIYVNMSMSKYYPVYTNIINDDSILYTSIEFINKKFGMNKIASVDDHIYASIGSINRKCCKIPVNSVATQTEYYDYCHSCKKKLKKKRSWLNKINCFNLYKPKY
jgi:hypothetical protein